VVPATGPSGAVTPPRIDMNTMLADSFMLALLTGTICHWNADNAPAMPVSAPDTVKTNSL